MRFAGLKNVEVCIPSRFHEGYGLDPENVTQLVSQGTKLIITTDCGITAVDACRKAHELGCRVIITDHHKPGERIPDCIAVLDPCLPSWEHYHLAYLSGAGVAYLLSRALFQYMGIDGDIPPNWAHDLLTFSIAGDGQALTGFNRHWVKLGMQSIASTKRPGLKALSIVAGLSVNAGDGLPGPKPTFEKDITFGLVPRLNAAGRMQHALIAYKLLREKDTCAAMKMAVELDKINMLRREIEGNIWKEAIEVLFRGRETETDLLAQYVCVCSIRLARRGLGIAASRSGRKQSACRYGWRCSPLLQVLSGNKWI